MNLKKLMLGAAVAAGVSMQVYGGSRVMQSTGENQPMRETAMTNPLVFGHNRLTLITPTLFRLESTTDGRFIDERTMFAYDRTSLLADSLYSVEKIEEEGIGSQYPVYRITTPALRIEYVDDGHPFSTSNLTAYFNYRGKEKKFTIRQIQRGNLGGPIETLDRVKSEVPLGNGLLSTDGWHVIDDNRADFLDSDGWISPRPYMPGHLHDFYCFVYGTDYRAALRSLGAISGRTPMTRKWVHGVWYSKYQDYSTEELLEVIDGYRRHGYPLDNAVLDMGWHTNILDNGTGHNGKRHWTGYTWNRNLISDPKALIDTIHSMGLTLTLNDHPHDGLRPGDERYADFARSLGYDPEGKEIPQFDSGSRRYMEALFRYGHGPTDSLGLDLWWVDWQQNYIYPYVAGTNTRTLPWLNEIFYRHSLRNGKRGATYSRWGGWGDHRHPLHFSGDAYTNWDMLAFEIKLTIASGNAGCFFWAHDIGGHKETGGGELLARWVQFGAMSAALRIHSSRTPEYDRRPWLCGDSLAERSMYAAYRLRSEMMPYTYTSVRQTHDEMVPLTRPMYIDYSGSKEALRYGKQYMYGDLLLTAPIDTIGTGSERMASQTVWFPDGDEWYDFFTHEKHAGGTVAEISKPLESFPLFIKAGWIMPMQPFTMRPASEIPHALVLRVYPSSDDCSNLFSLYEDDGTSMEYEKGRYSRTGLRYERSGEWHSVSVLPAEGEYDGQPEKRSYRLELGTEKPCDVTVDGRKARIGFDDVKNIYTVDIPATPVRKSITVRYRYA